MAMIEIKESSDVWKPENKGDKLHGYLDRVEPSPKYSNKIYKILLSEKYNQTKGQVTTVFGTKILDSKMKQVNIGAEVEIIYQGFETSKQGRKFKNWSVLMNEADQIKTVKIG